MCKLEYQYHPSRKLLQYVYCQRRYSLNLVLFTIHIISRSKRKFVFKILIGLIYSITFRSVCVESLRRSAHKVTASSLLIQVYNIQRNSLSETLEELSKILKSNLIKCLYNKHGGMITDLNTLR